MLETIWKKIDDLACEVSSTGLVRDSETKELRKSRIDQYGYATVYLGVRANPRQRKVHILVASAFIGNRPDGLVINHIDGNKANNAVENLEYCTQAENVRHAYKTGLQKPTRGSARHTSKLSESQVLEIMAIEGTAKHREIGARFGVGRKTIAAIYAGITWNHLTGRDYSNRNKDRGSQSHVANRKEQG